MSNKEAALLIFVQLFTVMFMCFLFYTVIRMSGVSLSLEDICDMKLCEISPESWFVCGVGLFMVGDVFFVEKDNILYSVN